MCLSPVATGTIKSKVVSQAERQYLLLNLLESQLMVIPHAKILLGLLILLSWDMNRRIIMVSQTSCDKGSVTLVSLNLLLTLLHEHCCWGKNNTLHAMTRQLMIKRETEAAGLITAYEHGIVPVMKTHGFYIAYDFAVVAFNLHRVFSRLFLICITTKRKVFLVNVHSDKNCAIIHLMTSICMR